MRKFFIPVIVIASSVIVSCQPSQLSNTQLQQTPTTTKTKYVYPPEAISDYVDLCTKGGSTPKECSCFISKAQDIYPLDKLIQINNDSSAGKPNPKDIDEILKSCQEKVAVVPGINLSSDENAKRFIKGYLDAIVSGESGDGFFCDKQSVSTFFAPRDYKILKVKMFDTVGSAVVRLDSSNQGGSQVTNFWEFYLKRGNPQYSYSIGEAGKYGICLSFISKRDGQ